MSEKVVTVLGEISSEELGVVLPHEHLLWDLRCWAHEEPRELFEREKVRRPVTLENRGHVVYHPFHYRDNLQQTDIQVAVEEAVKFGAAGGNTICDVTPPQLGRDPSALRHIARETGLNIIMACAFYVGSSWSEEEKAKSVEELRDELINEFRNGVGFFKTRPGVLGEVGISNINNPLEIKNLQASGSAQHVLGCPVTVHTPIWEKDGHRILDILEESGADVHKVSLAHLDPTMKDYDYAGSLAKRGAYIEYDLFDTHIMSFEGWFLPSDNDRIEAIQEQIGRGNLEHILISHDICMKIKLTRWGGQGYAHILENIVPRLLQAGLTEEQIRTILVDNPRRFLSW